MSIFVLFYPTIMNEVMNEVIMILQVLLVY